MSILPDLPEPSSDGQNQEYLHEDTDFQEQYPAIYEYLCRVIYRGQPRQSSRLVIYYEDGQATLMLTDPHTARLLFHVSEGVSEGLESLERRLQDAPVKGWKKDKKHRYPR